METIRGLNKNSLVVLNGTEGMNSRYLSFTLLQSNRIKGSVVFISNSGYEYYMYL